MNWALSRYNLIVYGHTDCNVFRRLQGNGRFLRERLFEYTSRDLKNHYQRNLAGLAELPTLVTAETHRGPTQAFFSSIDHIREVRREITFRFKHLREIRISAEEIFECEYFDIESGEKSRNHWAIKEGNLLEAFFKLRQMGGFYRLFQNRGEANRPRFFSVEQWPLPVLGHIAVMMPFKVEFSPVYEAIKQACGSLDIETQRVDDIYTTARIVDDVFTTIAQSRLVICDLTDRNANVLYETGLAHTLNRDVIMITQNLSDIPFDLRQRRVISYLPNQEGLLEMKEELKRALQAILIQ